MMAKNLETTQSKPPEWRPDNLQASLDRLYAWVDEQTSSVVRWYYENKAWKSIASRSLRLLAIVFGAAGALIPMCSIIIGGDEHQTLMVNQVGYIVLGLAALCIALDRFYGYSTGWMRYIHTALMIEGLQETFRLEWSKLRAEQGTQSIDTARLERFVALIQRLVVAVRAHVQKETEDWMAEFQSSLVQLEQETAHAWEGAHAEARKNAEAIEAVRLAESEEQRPGAIQITIVGNGAFDEGLQVELDGKPHLDHVTGTTCGIAKVPPGLHEVALAGLVSGKWRLASKVVAVEPNQLATVSLELVPLSRLLKPPVDHDLRSRWTGGR
ncbi:SLATT domain-containing protein [Corallococcus sp. AS-1-12]|nr:SLATT domain-containing protein [Corallococcus sp. AS-1-12]